MPYRIVHFENGTASIEDTLLNEPMHSRIGPEAEAKSLYLDQSQLHELLTKNSETPIVLFDVGLGLAINALLPIEMALAQEFPKELPKKLPQKLQRTLEIHSFENETAGIQFALSNIESFKFLEPHRSKIDTLLSHGQWSSHNQKIIWKLHIGDFREIDLMKLPSPEIIFYDFHSPKISQSLWTEDIFNKIYASCRRNMEKKLNTILITYSSARSVRNAMIAAGFHVRNGIPTSAKRDTTIASTLPF